MAEIGRDPIKIISPVETPEIIGIAHDFIGGTMIGLKEGIGASLDNLIKHTDLIKNKGHFMTVLKATADTHVDAIAKFNQYKGKRPKLKLGYESEFKRRVIDRLDPNEAKNPKVERFFKLYGERIESLLVEVVQNKVSAEIEKIKKSLLDD